MGAAYGPCLCGAAAPTLEEPKARMPARSATACAMVGCTRAPPKSTTQEHHPRAPRPRSRTVRPPALATSYQHAYNVVAETWLTSEGQVVNYDYCQGQMCLGLGITSDFLFPEFESRICTRPTVATPTGNTPTTHKHQPKPINMPALARQKSVRPQASAAAAYDGAHEAAPIKIERN